jgi:hypothetical protein
MPTTQDRADNQARASIVVDWIGIRDDIRYLIRRALEIPIQIRDSVAEIRNHWQIIVPSILSAILLIAMIHFYEHGKAREKVHYQIIEEEIKRSLRQYIEAEQEKLMRSPTVFEKILSIFVMIANI